jgi:hypothetical protein
MIKQGFLSSDPTLSFNLPSSTTPPQMKMVSNNGRSNRSLNNLSPPYTTTPVYPDHQNQTLFQIMSEEQNHQSKISKIMKEFEDLNCYGRGDVRLTVIGKDGHTRISMDVHKRVLLEKSGFFRDTLRGRDQGVVMQSVEISDCDDVEVYLETLVLMYSHDLKRRLMDEDVSRVLAFLKVYLNSLSFLVFFLSSRSRLSWVLIFDASCPFLLFIFFNFQGRDLCVK